MSGVGIGNELVNEIDVSRILFPVKIESKWLSNPPMDRNNRNFERVIRADGTK